eukprot:1153237-Pelagomonas_calceolata.AAC.1
MPGAVTFQHTEVKTVSSKLKNQGYRKGERTMNQDDHVLKVTTLSKFLCKTLPTSRIKEKEAHWLKEP